MLTADSCCAGGWMTVTSRRLCDGSGAAGHGLGQAGRWLLLRQLEQRCPHSSAVILAEVSQFGLLV